MCVDSCLYPLKHLRGEEQKNNPTDSIETKTTLYALFLLMYTLCALCVHFASCFFLLFEKRLGIKFNDFIEITYNIFSPRSHDFSPANKDIYLNETG